MKSPFLRRFGMPSPFFDNETGFSPNALFALAQPGAWYDPSDLTTLFQDTAGTTPVTTAGQSVALALDKSKGLVLGSELVTNGDFSVDANWTKGAGWTISGGVASANIAAGVNLDQLLTTTINKTYQVTFTITSYTSGGIRARFTGTANISGAVRSAAGTYTELFHATATNNVFRMVDGGAGFVGSIDNISVKELPGNHATQSTAASRPLYGVVPATGRRNLLTFTEQFDNAAWGKGGATITANAAVAPDGTTTADLVLEDTSTGPHRVFQTVTIPAATHAFSFYAKPSGRDWVYVYVNGGVETAFVNVSTGAIGTVVGSPNLSVTPVGNGWYRISLGFSNTLTAAQNIQIWASSANGATNYTGNGTSGILIWGAQLELGSTATAYQRVVSALDVTEAGVQSLSYLSFDGVDDFLVTPTITPATDKAQVFAGVRKLSDAAAAILLESSATIGSNNGVVGVTAPLNTSGSTFGFASKGTAFTAWSVSGSSFAAPSTVVLTGLGDIAADTQILRLNGAQIQNLTNDQGTGNYLAYPLYIGRRGGTTLPFNGNIFSLIVRFGANLDAGTISQTETWVNGKTRAY